MARWLVPLLPHYAAHRYIHNALNISFTVACVAAMIAIISALCSSCHKKPKQKKSAKTPCSNNSSPEKPRLNSEFETATAHILALQQNVSKNNLSAPQKEEAKVVELTPDVATHGPIPPAVLPFSTSRSMSKKRLSISISKKLPDLMRTSRKEKKDHAEPGEDMIWKKAIILGEKCRVSSDDEEEGCLKNYYPRTPRSRTMSRANSFANNDVAPRMSSVAQSDLNLERREEGSEQNN
jgi:hypothetical protein